MDVGTLAAFLELDTGPFDKELGGVGGKLGKLGPIFAGAGAAAGAALVKGVMMNMNIEAANDKLAAQLGLNAQQSEAFGRAAGNLYANAYGDSIEHVNEALKNVSQNIGEHIGPAEDALETITARALDLTAAFDTDLSMATQAVGTIMRTGLAADAEEAFDVITVGMQNGANKADDLLETFQEYSTMFRDIGLTAADAMGLITQGLQAGARDADTVADALKEFAIRGQDASTASAEGFKAIGLNAEDMTAKIARGGPDARDALDQVLDRLRNMEDPVKRNAAAVALFGTKAEDLGDSLFALDPTTAVEGLGEVEGAAKKMGDTLADNAQTKIESFKRKGLMMLTEASASVITKLQEFAPTFQDIGDWVSDVVDTIEQLWPRIVEAVQPVMDDVMAMIEDLVEIGTTLWDNFGTNLLGVVEEVWPRIWQVIQGAVDVIAGIIHLFSALLQGDWSEVWEAVKQILSGAWQMINGIIAAALSVIQGILGAAWEVVKSTAAAAWRSVWSTVTGWIGSIVEAVKSLPGKITNAARGLWEGLKGGLVSIINWVITQLNKISFKMPDIPGLPGRGKRFGINIDPIAGPVRASGGGGGGGPMLKMHTGGHLPGGANDEFLRVLQGGETVLARNDPLNRAIHSANDRAGGGRRAAGSRVEVEAGFSRGATTLEDAILEMLRYRVRIDGGDVQQALGA